jgi:hypothetical protein
MDRNKNQSPNVLPNSLMEEWMDAAAGEAIGANAPAESEAYAKELAAATPAGKRLDRELRETVAMISAASPFLDPPEDLRGRVLQATAPATFRMEDYRKANRETGRFYRWGFYAAMLCLMAGAWYNLTIKSALTSAQGHLAVVQKQADERNEALRAFVNPNVDQITFHDHGKVIGKALVDEKSRRAVVILPQGMIPAGKLPQLSLPKDGKIVTYDTTLVIAPPNMLDAPTGKSLDSMLTVTDISPDPKQPKIAGK